MESEKKSAKPLIYGAYSRLLHGGRHHGSIQTGYRIMASTWLLATFAACGFILSQDDMLPFNHLLGIVFACILGILGLYLLWYADTFVEELLLDVNVVEALRMEKEHAWLPQLHHCFLHLYKTTNARIVKVLFFVGCKTILVMMIFLSLALYFVDSGIMAIGAIFLVCACINYISSRYMIYRSGKIQELMEYLERVDEGR